MATKFIVLLLAARALARRDSPLGDERGGRRGRGEAGAAPAASAAAAARRRRRRGSRVGSGISCGRAAVEARHARGRARGRRRCARRTVRVPALVAVGATDAQAFLVLGARRSRRQRNARELGVCRAHARAHVAVRPVRLRAHTNTARRRSRTRRTPSCRVLRRAARTCSAVAPRRRRLPRRSSRARARLTRARTPRAEPLPRRPVERHAGCPARGARVRSTRPRTTAIARSTSRCRGSRRVRRVLRELRGRGAARAGPQSGATR